MWPWMKWDRTGPTFLVLPCFFCFWKGLCKVGLKDHHTAASLYSREETEAPKWGVTVWGETGRPEKVKKKKKRMVEVP